MMTTEAVEVRLAGLLARYSPSGRCHPTGGARPLSVDRGGGRDRHPAPAALCGRRERPDSDWLSTILAPGDRLTLLPPIAGG